jgi:hypothetical protein
LKTNAVKGKATIKMTAASPIHASGDSFAMIRWGLNRDAKLGGN